MDEIEISVTAECTDGTKFGRLINLPSDEARLTDNNIDDDRENFFDESFPGLDSDSALHRDGPNPFGPSDKIQFRITSGDCDLQAGSSVMGQVIHIPSETIIVEETLIAS